MSKKKPSVVVGLLYKSIICCFFLLSAGKECHELVTCIWIYHWDGFWAGANIPSHSHQPQQQPKKTKTSCNIQYKHTHMKQIKGMFIQRPLFAKAYIYTVYLILLSLYNDDDHHHRRYVAYPMIVVNRNLKILFPRYDVPHDVRYHTPMPHA